MPKPPYIRNAALAFLFGGLVCIVGQLITDIYKQTMGMSSTGTGNPVLATMIFIGTLLTGFGVFDKLARYGGAGLAVPSWPGELYLILSEG